MEIIGYLASILIGVSLGLIGGGGSILTVPVLVYLFGVDAFMAAEYSLFIVGISSSVGSFSYFKKGFVSVRTALVFGIPSIISIFLTRTYLLPLIPQNIFYFGDFILTKNTLLLLIFAILMILASYKMLQKPGAVKEPTKSNKRNSLLAVIQGLIIGMMTGFVGAGGGFMIIPALVNLLKTPMKTAIGTSLVIISLNSLIGFFSSMNHLKIEWSLLVSISLIAVIGIIIGIQISKKVDGEKLKPIFGWFILVMGIYIIAKETFL